jgi:hypothetical protein
LLEAFIPPRSEGFFLYYPSRRQNLASLRTLIDFLRTNLKARTGSSREEPADDLAEAADEGSNDALKAK